MVVDNAAGTKYVTVPAGNTELPANTLARLAVQWNAGTLSLNLNGTTQGAPTGAGSGVHSALPTTLYCGEKNDGTTLINSSGIKVLGFERDLSSQEVSDQFAIL